MRIEAIDYKKLQGAILIRCTQEVFLMNKSVRELNN
jgi:hypothetical protein